MEFDRDNCSLGHFGFAYGLQTIKLAVLRSKVISHKSANCRTGAWIPKIPLKVRWNSITYSGCRLQKFELIHSFDNKMNLTKGCLTFSPWSANTMWNWMELAEPISNSSICRSGGISNKHRQCQGTSPRHVEHNNDVKPDSVGTGFTPMPCSPLWKIHRMWAFFRFMIWIFHLRWWILSSLYSNFMSRINQESRPNKTQAYPVQFSDLMNPHAI